ncbi:MAG: Ldh family oxidoreductase [Spirochaetota bacterium]|nr:Ldh family oxidoreductase [Spirochaetota bacterium]
MENKRIPVKRMEEFIKSAFESQGARKEHAAVCAQRMVESDLQGMHGHGIFRLPPYMRRLKEGGYNLDPEIRIIKETGNSALVDGDNGLGHVVVSFAVDTAIQKAKENGIAWVGTRNSNHAGAGGSYAVSALEHDMIGIYMAIGNANHMPPWGGVDPLLSTNPICFAIPTKEEYPVLLDMATTVVSYGKVKVYAQTGKEMPEGWMIDRQGKPLTDPKRISEGFLMPIGAHKGYGLNFIIGALAGVLNSAAFGKDVINFNEDFHSKTNSGQTFIAMRVDLFREVEEFKKMMDEKIREMKACTPMNPGQEILLPGEIGYIERPRILKEGVPVSETLLGQLQELARDCGLSDTLEDL